MELLTPLQTVAADKPLTERDVAKLGIDMCRALTLCRSRGIIHRDIKPENIFVSRDGNYKLGDFGVARVAEKTVSAMSRKGTYNYMAPEVYKNEKYGFGADIYSLGIVLYRYLNNNRVPFLPPYPAPIQYSDKESALARRMSGEAVPMPESGGEALKRAVLKACAYRVEDRYDSAESFLAELESVMRAMDGKTEGDGAAERTEEKAADVKGKPEVSKIRPAGSGALPESGREPGKNSGKTSGKDSGKKKRVPLAVILGAVFLIVAVFLIKAAFGGSGTLPSQEEDKEAAMSQAMQDVLASLETPTDAAWLASRKAAIESFDTRLVGDWEPLFGKQDNGSKSVDGLDCHITILETGEFYLIGKSEWLRHMEEQIPLPSMTAEDGKTNLVEAARNVYDDGERGAGHIYTLWPSISNLSVTYELTDYEVEEGSYDEAFYGSREEDGLTIRIQGNYQDGPLTVKTIDTSFYFKRNYRMEEWFFRGLEGRWTDSNGYIWAFRIAREPACRMVFAMKDSSGQVHEGISFTEDYNYDTAMTSLQIRFQDGITVPEYTLTGYDGMTLELEGKGGSRLVLTRG